MANVIISQLNSNEKHRFSAAGYRCCYCGEKITGIPVSVKYKVGRSCIYNFFHLSCYLFAKPRGFVTNGQGLENLFEKGI